MNLQPSTFNIEHPILRSRRFRFDVRCFVGFFLAATLFTSCSRKPAQQGPPGVPVLVAKAESRDVPVEIQAIGTVQAFSRVAVRSQITGPIYKVHFQEGQDVKAGDLLFTIDPRPYEAAVNQAEANWKRDEAQMINARLTFERTSNLFVAKIASQQDYDTSEAGYIAAQATLLADGAAVTNAKVGLDYTAIRAPIDGRTGDLAVKEGNVVKAPDDTIVSLTQIHPVYVAFAVPEMHLSAIRHRAAETTLAVRAVAPSDTNYPASGELTFIDNTVDTNTGTILLKGTFPNTDNALWPGQFVQVVLTLSNLASAVVVPSQAVQNSQNGELVFVIKSDGTAEPRTVLTSVRDSGKTVITTGVQPGETVVVDGQLRLTPGAKVDAKPAAAAGTNVAETAERK